MPQEQLPPQNQEPTMSDAEMAAREAEAEQLLGKNYKFEEAHRANQAFMGNWKEIAANAEDPAEREAIQKILSHKLPSPKEPARQEHNPGTPSAETVVVQPPSTSPSSLLSRIKRWLR